MKSHTLNTKGWPKTLHGLVALALRDLERGEKSKRIHVQMHTWVSGTKDSCAGCLAGMVLLGHGRLAAVAPSRDLGLGPGVLPEKFKGYMYALDAVRQGRLRTAAMNHSAAVGRRFERVLQKQAIGKGSKKYFLHETFPVIDYDIGPSARSLFKTDLRQIIKLLKFHKI